jgi:hypothetical protein
MFENLGLQSFAKTSGLKGLQLYIPLNSPQATYEQTKGFAKAVAELLASAEPDLVVSRMTKARRTGKVLIDWSQNDRRKTTVCAYSLRAGERPTVSTPVDWDEVRSTSESGQPNDLVFEAQAVLERVTERGDLFAPVLSSVQRLPGSTAAQPGATSSSGPSRSGSARLTAGFAGRAARRALGSAWQSEITSSPERLGSSHARCASSSARITGIRSWIARARRLGVESHVNRVTLWTHSSATLAGVHSAANANGSPPSSWK